MTSERHRATNSIVSMVGGGRASAPIHHVWNVIAKLNSGEYKTETSPCFCGADHDDVTASNYDRYGIPHKMVMCRQCGIIRANPRMTEESYRKFYETEYRKIYIEDGMTKDEEFLAHIQGGMSLMEFVDYYDLKRDSVIDVGCNMGEWLIPFKNAGSKVVGVDYDVESIEEGKKLGLDLIAGNMDVLIERGEKADIVIMNHVLEHILDIEPALEKVKSLLTPDGIFFVGVPGVYGWKDSNKLVQNAHVWQFNADTLEYVMNCCGWDAWHLDEFIWSAWKPMEQRLSKSKKPFHAPGDISGFLSGGITKLPKVRTMTKFPVKERKKNIELAMSYRLPNIRELDGKYSGDLVIVAGGPSINAYKDKIRELKESGAKVITIERMYDWCHDTGITPDFAAILDACDDVKEGLQNIKPGTKWLISCIANKETMEILKDQDSYIYFTEQKGIDQADMWYKYGYEKIRIVNAGGSVALASFALGMALGFRNFHVFGFDCHVTGGNYAKGIRGEGVVRNEFEVTIGDRVFLTTSPFLSFMQQFFILYAAGKNKNLIDSVKVYGDSLIKAASKIDIDGDK